jgi:hypothetical protein
MGHFDDGVGLLTSRQFEYLHFNLLLIWSLWNGGI